MDKTKVISRLIQRKEECQMLLEKVKDKEVRAQLIGEGWGLDYAIGLLYLEGNNE